MSSNFSALVTKDSLAYSISVLIFSSFLPSLSLGTLAPKCVLPSPFISVLTPKCSLFSSVSVLLLRSAVSRLCSRKLLY